VEVGLPAVERYSRIRPGRVETRHMWEGQLSQCQIAGAELVNHAKCQFIEPALLEVRLVEPIKTRVATNRRATIYTSSPVRLAT